MTGQVPTKLRLVRCPKCRRVLPELANVPVYQCGGCGTVLQAKKRKVAPEDADTQVTESVPVLKNEPKNISCEKEAQKSNRDETMPLTCHHPMETNFEINQSEIQVCSEEHSIDSDSSPDISKKSKHSGNGESTVNIEEDGCVSKDVDSSAGSTEELMHYRNDKSNPEVDRDEFVSKEAEPSTGFSKLINHENVESTRDIEDDECVSKGAESLIGFSEELMHHGSLVSSPEINKEESVSKDVESPTRFSVSTPDVDTKNLERDEYLSKQIDGDDEKKNEHCKEKVHKHVSFSDELVYSPEFNHLEHEEDENETFLELANETNRNKSLSGVESEVKSDEDFRNHDMFGSSPEEEILDQSVLNSDILSPHSEVLECSQDRTSFYNHEHMSSIDTLDNIVALRDFPESPMTRSYYGFYGSGSSCDGNDDHVPDRKFHLSKRTLEKEITNGKSLLRNGESPKKSREDQDMQGQNGYFISSSLGNRKAAKIEKSGLQHRFPFHPRDQGVGYYSYGNYPNDEMGTNFHLPNKREYLEEEKMELLKKVRELEDQLKKTQISKRANFSILGENQVRPNYDDLMYNQKFDRSNHSRFSRIPFSSEATTSKNIHTNNSGAVKVHAKRLYLGKKHTLPVTGGAPFLLCYHCSEVLQVPADFLLFQRRYHKLKCGNCSVTLKFSLKNRTQIVKYIDHSSKDLSENELVSIDEPGPSFCKSFSTEEAPSSIEPQLDDMKTNFPEKKISSSKKGSKFTNFVKNLGYVRSSSKSSKAEISTSESEEVPASANSPLHRLMGYHSATILLKADDLW